MDDTGSDAAPVAAPDGPRKREPAFNLPGSLVAALALLALIHVVRTYLISADADEWVLLNFAFIAARYLPEYMAADWVWLWTPVTYSLLHGSWEHLLFNSFWMVAFGAPVVRRIGTRRFVLFWCLSAAASAALHCAFHWGEVTVVIGASGVVSGLMGAATRFVFSSGGEMARRQPHLNRRLTVREALSNRSVLVFCAVWFLTNLAIGFGQMFAGSEGATIAWEAHIGGFLFGFFCLPLFDRHPAAAAQESGRG
ncbi:rhomboid family intramembrane serine protease [Mycoplana dimorpha]|uniref:Membrane associated rhomboid family serine protease n=1 Tax=Mycoplana dimorpha TaxID=28320 RepID=A0A2T5B7P2_MYCDI|nr:rhomboid family intramembrane serine protease [Mycoplana dimorpha]PTM94964.1 membrane associated rhomboid family serine protease [Mycoplana dimorpha]